MLRVPAAAAFVRASANACLPPPRAAVFRATRVFTLSRRAPLSLYRLARHRQEVARHQNAAIARPVVKVSAAFRRHPQSHADVARYRRLVPIACFSKCVRSRWGRSPPSVKRAVAKCKCSGRRRPPAPPRPTSVDAVHIRVVDQRQNAVAPCPKAKAGVRNRGTG